MAMFMVFLIGIPLLVYLFYKAVEFENNKLAEQRRVAEAVKQSSVRKKEAEKAEAERMKELGLMKVSISTLEKYINGAAMDSETYDKYEEAILEGISYVWVEKVRIDAMKKKAALFIKNSQILALTASLNNEGIKLEKDGDIDGAIASYERNISIGNAAHHSYQRLLVLYRKRKDYQNELRVIERACAVFNDPSWYLERKEKINKLININ